MGHFALHSIYNSLSHSHLCYYKLLWEKFENKLFDMNENIGYQICEMLNLDLWF